MSVARGKNVASLLQRGYGVRSTPFSAFSGFNPSSKKEENLTSTSSHLMPTNFVGGADSGRRFLHVRPGQRKMRGVRKPRVMVSTPTMDVANLLPLTEKEMANSELVTLGAMGNSSARKEILRRHIMSVDKVSYETASATFEEIAAQNRKGMWLLSLPYKVGITAALGAAAWSVPLVFDLNTVSWFNHAYVTADIPEPKDLETWLEVGAWSWNWMEPVLGQVSFVLLCLQYTRAQIANIGIRPYTDKVNHMRAKGLAQSYPQYNEKVVMDFSKAVTFYGDKHGILA